MKGHLPELDADNVTFIMRDGKNSITISKARRQHLPRTHGFYCVRHASEEAQVAIGGGQAIVSEYINLATALTAPAQAYVKLRGFAFAGSGLVSKRTYKIATAFGAPAHATLKCTYVS